MDEINKNTENFKTQLEYLGVERTSGIINKVLNLYKNEQDKNDSWVGYSLKSDIVDLIYDEYIISVINDVEEFTDYEFLRLKSNLKHSEKFKEDLKKYSGEFIEIYHDLKRLEIYHDLKLSKNEV